MASPSSHRIPSGILHQIGAPPSSFRTTLGYNDNMEVDTPSQNLMRLLAEKTKENQAAKEIGTKRTREKTIANKSLHQTPQRRPQAPKVSSIFPEQRIRQNFWYGFTNMEKLAMEEGLDELFDGNLLKIGYLEEYQGKKRMSWRASRYPSLGYHKPIIQAREMTIL